MAANVESMAFFGATPWHGEGTKATEESRFNWEEFGTLAGIRWTAHKEPLVTVPQAQKAIDYAFGLDGSKDDCPSIEANTDQFAVVRDTDKRILGTVGPRYRICQNDEALSWFDPWLQTQTLSMHTGGSLNEGSKVWVLAQVVQDTIMEVASGDEIAKFVLFSNSFDGTTAIRVGFTPIRVVCANTLAMAHSAKVSKLLRVRHSSQTGINLDRIREIMDTANQEFTATAEQFRFLASRHVNRSDLRKYVKILLDVDMEKPEDKLPTRTVNLIGDVVKLMDDPKQTIRSISGTWWAAYNAFNQHLNYEYGRSVGGRLNNLWYGQNAEANNRALELAVEMAA
jgi:phage/plasmid-like protein (TIGR03299 family)